MAKAICQVEDKTERLAKIAELHLAALKEGKSSLIVTPTRTANAGQFAVRCVKRAALQEAACRPSERLSSIEIGSENEIDDLLTRLQRSARRGPSLDRCAEIQQPAKEHESGIER